jgi:hypothetical protein
MIDWFATSHIYKPETPMTHTASIYCLKTMPPPFNTDPEDLSESTRELMLFAAAIRNSNPDITFQIDESPDYPELPLKTARLFPDLFTA